MQTVTSSTVVTRALGMAPDGIACKQEGDCAYCGLHINPGDLYIPFAPGPSFMDTSSLAAKGSELTCGHCAVLLSASGLLAGGYGVFHEKGVMPFRKWKDVRAALIDPPAGPFVLCYATAKNQHMAWRATVNYSRDLFYVRVGLRDLKIRRLPLLHALTTAERMGRQIGREPTVTKSGEIRSLPTPFNGLSPDLKDVGAGMLDSKVWTQCARQDIDEILSLTTGELWAMRFLVSPGAGTDPEPEES